jgi:17beta-estradiol 17-dehydrogenase / very-long-chain 3-oxoacyl-CoA reductase
MLSLTSMLASLGALVLLSTVYSALRLVAIYTGTSRIHRYLYGAAPYALVTGATDGIGKAVARELYVRGFNLILHGRNESKLQRVREEIQSAGSPRKDVKLWVADATSPEVDFEAAVRQWEGLDITLVVHNVGGAPIRDTT